MTARSVERRGSRVKRRRPVVRGRPDPRPLTLDSRLRRIRALLCDVDGVLTDGTIFIGGETEIKAFSIQDGMGLTLLRRSGIKVGWISHRPSAATARRAAELKIDFLHQASSGKVPAINAILEQSGLSWDEICYVGDDLLDLGALKRAGVAVAVSNGAVEARAVADYVTQSPGGRGAVRETAELILKAQHKWDRLLTDCEA